MIESGRSTESPNKMPMGLTGAGIVCLGLLATACTPGKSAAQHDSRISSSVIQPSDVPATTHKSVHSSDKLTPTTVSTAGSTVIVLTAQPSRPNVSPTISDSGFPQTTRSSQRPTNPSTRPQQPTASKAKVHALNARDIPAIWSQNALVGASSIDGDQVIVAYDYGIAPSGNGAFQVKLTNLPAGDGDLGKPELPMILTCEGNTLVGQAATGALSTFAGNIACSDGQLTSKEAVYLPRPHQLNSNIY